MESNRILNLLYEGVRINSNTVLDLCTVLFRTPYRNVITRITRRILVICTCLTDLNVRRLNPSILMLVDRLMDVEIRLAI